jgi:DNA polymerase III epsilon subunit-like protein
MNSFLEGKDDYTIVGHNILSFDLPMISNELSRCNSKVNLLKYKKKDTMIIERSLNKNTLEATYKRRTGKSLDDAHDAKVDVIATKEVFESQLIDPEYKDELGSNEFYDFEGKFLLDENKKLPIWNFGKHKGKVVYEELEYLKWYISLPDVPPYLAQKLREDWVVYNNSIKI